MTTLRAALAIILVTAAAPGCTDAGFSVDDGGADRGTVEVFAHPDSVPPPCVWSEPRSYEIGDTVRIAQPDAPRCRVVILDEGVRLAPDTAGTHPDPSWTSVARDSRGRFYTSPTNASGTGRILVWGPDGRFEKTVGRPGEGPGELIGRGLAAVFVDRWDTLYAREGVRWAVFSPEHAHARLITAASVATGRGSTHVLDDGRFLSTAPVAVDGDPGAWFHIVAPDGTHERSFGDATGYRLAGGRLPARASAYGGGETFWVAAPPGGSGAYRIEEWRTDGTLLRVLERPAPWVGDAEVEGEGGRREMVLPVYGPLAVDEDGLLWHWTVTRDPRWASSQPGTDSFDPDLDEMFDLRWDVIDPEAGELLAWGIVDALPREDESGHSRFSMFIPRTSLSYRPVPDALGFETLEIVRPLVVGR